MIKRTFNNYMINTIVIGPLQTILIGITIFYYSKNLFSRYLILVFILDIIKLTIAYLSTTSSKSDFILVKKEFD